jgi:energy-coupling factor transporter ATP-binding protein EcfA2
LIKITLRNYRGFTSAKPAEFQIGKGFTSLIGKNNAGKSTCLKAIYELRNVFSASDVWNGANSGFVGLNILSEPDFTVIFNNSNEEPVYITLSIDATLSDQFYTLTSTTICLNRNGSFNLVSTRIASSGNVVEIKPPYTSVNSVNLGVESGLQVSTEGLTYPYVFSQLIEAVKSLSNSVYFGAYRNAINEGASRYYDLSVGTGLVTLWDQWKAGSSISQKKAIAKVESDVERLLGYKNVQINPSSDNKTLDVIIDKQPLRLADLGAGVAELIITLSTALVIKPSFILIDEPESHLHPSLQVDFLTTLAEYASIGLAFSTHSMGLARTISDRIYAVTKNSDSSSCVTYEKSANLAELLGSLSYTGYFPLESAYILLVEGSTEVRTFQTLLRRLHKDHMYVILPLGGSSLIKENSELELSEVIRIAGSSEKVFAIFDSEKKSDKDPLDKSRLAFSTTCEKLGIKYLVTEKRATENYFSDSAIKKSLGNGFSNLTDFELLKDSKNGWSKVDNWRIAANETNEFFSSHDLGLFIAELPKE